jgi:uncharacterized protein YbjT (DUF2867 family)
MKVLIFGATGMLGQAVLRECLLDPDVELTVTVGRSATGGQNARLKEIVHRDLSNYAGMEQVLTGFDACFYCLGVSSSGMNETEYMRITYEFTLAAAEPLSRLNPRMTFIYVSGSGTDSTENGRSMWARVKGRTENALLRLPFKSYMFRPGFIQPLDGIESKTPSYRIFYKVLSPVMPLIKRALPNHVLTTRQIGEAMLSIARQGFAKSILEPKDIRSAANR